MLAAVYFGVDSFLKLFHIPFLCLTHLQHNSSNVAGRRATVCRRNSQPEAARPQTAHTRTRIARNIHPMLFPDAMYGLTCVGRSMRILSFSSFVCLAGQLMLDGQRNVCHGLFSAPPLDSCQLYVRQRCFLYRITVTAGMDVDVLGPLAAAFRSTQKLAEKAKSDKATAVTAGAEQASAFCVLSENCAQLPAALRVNAARSAHVLK